MDNNGFYKLTNVDWAGDYEEWKSTTGYLFPLSNEPITWCSHKQPTGALSSIEVKYQALAERAKETTWLWYLFQTLKMLQNQTITIHVNNQSCIKIAKNPIFHAHTKHIKMHCHFIQEKILSSEIDVKHVNIENQVVEILTKSLGKHKFQKFRNMMEIHHLHMIQTL